MGARAHEALLKVKGEAGEFSAITRSPAADIRRVAEVRRGTIKRLLSSSVTVEVELSLAQLLLPSVLLIHDRCLSETADHWADPIVAVRPTIL